MNTKLRTGWHLTVLALGLVTQGVLAQDDGAADPFSGRLFPPNVILEHGRELDLSDAQRQEIREIVISTQTEVSEHEWDMREAYLDVMSELDRPTINESVVAEMIQVVLETENKVKLAQMSMLIRLRNLLTDQQIASLRAVSQ